MWPLLLVAGGLWLIERGRYAQQRGQSAKLN